MSCEGRPTKLMNKLNFETIYTIPLSKRKAKVKSPRDQNSIYVPNLYDKYSTRPCGPDYRSLRITTQNSYDDAGDDFSENFDRSITINNVTL